MLPSRHTADSTITLLTELVCTWSRAARQVQQVQFCRSVRTMHNNTHLYTGAMLLAAQAAQ
jgi:hypothetical protein